ncbi:outer membrane beta-barrel protein [Sphingomonas sp. CV7422]|uniref:outer membrane beta-barrel protein n=1 Tax=Sphingomonas sp. CV7422 TaxID=3018036 RepID=UPI0022FDDFAD|nr:outer membrane beta-barrel protein [Sphingomonas sp. CV7422]
MRLPLVALAGMLTLPFAASAAEAQSTDANLVLPNLPLDFDRGKNTSVLQRERPEYQAQGVRAGSFLLYPKLELGAGFTDNAYQVDSNKQSDVYALIAPSIAANSNWSTNELNFNAGARLRRFSSETPRNETNYNLDASGRLDATRSLSFNTLLRTARSTEPRSSAASPQDAAEAIQFQQTTASVGSAFAGARIRGQVAVSVDQFNFSDVRSFSNTIISQQNRDQVLLRTTARGEYAMSPDTSLFLQGGYTDTSYKYPLTIGIPNRDSKEVNVIGGASFDLSALIRGGIGLGYVSRRYDSPIYSDISGLSAEARVEYFPTQLTTVGLNVRRTIQDSYFGTSSGYFATAAAVRVDHELLRNLLLNAQLGYEQDDFANQDAKSKILRYSAGARYLLNRNFGFGLVVGRDNRTARGNVGLRAFDETRALLSIVVQR